MTHRVVGPGAPVTDQSSAGSGTILILMMLLAVIAPLGMLAFGERATLSLILVLPVLTGALVVSILPIWADRR